MLVMLEALNNIRGTAQPFRLHQEYEKHPPWVAGVSMELGLTCPSRSKYLNYVVAMFDQSGTL